MIVDINSNGTVNCKMMVFFQVPHIVSYQKTCKLIVLKDSASMCAKHNPGLNFKWYFMHVDII